jgi:hypothetical protein
MDVRGRFLIFRKSVQKVCGNVVRIASSFAKCPIRGEKAPGISVSEN